MKANRIRLTESELQNIIAESLMLMLESPEDGDITVTSNGQEIVFKAPNANKKYAKWKKQQMASKQGENTPKPKKKAKPKPKTDDAITDDSASPKGLAANVKKLVLSNRSVNSIYHFITNGDRQFGPNAVNIMTELFEKESGKNLFSSFRMLYRDILTTVGEIEKWGKKDEYAVYERARKLGNYLNDLADLIEEMGETYKKLTEKKAIVKQFGGTSNIINGSGHALGIIHMAFAKGYVFIGKLTGSMRSTANKLFSISDNGRNPFDYRI